MTDMRYTLWRDIVGGFAKTDYQNSNFAQASRALRGDVPIKTTKSSLSCDDRICTSAKLSTRASDIYSCDEMSPELSRLLWTLGGR